MFDIPAAIAASSNLINGVINRIWQDPTEADKNKLEKIRLELSNELAIVQAQTDINRKEAEHPSIFVSGARPFILWICGISLLYASLLEPIFRFIASVVFGYIGAFPTIDTDLTLQILLGMLGLSGMRSFERGRGVARVR